MKRLWNNSLATKFFLSYLILVALLFAGFYYSSSTLFRNFYFQWLSGRMGQEAVLLGRLLPVGVEGTEFDDSCRQLSRELGSRITVIALDGRVLGDSAEPSASMENHAGRPEVVGALQNGSGSAIRFSTTVGYDMLYQAFRQVGTAPARIIRVATPLRQVESALRSFRQTLLIGLLLAAATGLLLAWLFSRFLSRRFQRLVQFSGQIARGNFLEDFFPGNDSDEIARLERHLNEMSLKIRDHLSQVLREKDKVDSILRCMIEGVLVLDPKGYVLLINEQARAMFHAAEGRDLHGLSMAEISRHPEVHKILEEVLNFDFSGPRYTKEIELDDDRWFRVNAVSLRDAQDRSLGSILVFHDVTDIKRFESMRSDFVANVSHELRTPLTAIRGYVETLLETPPADPGDSRQFLEIIDRHSERLSRLTEDLLILSDLESGKIKLTLHPLDVGQLIQRVFEVFRDQAMKKNIKLEERLEADMSRLLGDLDRLQQLFINLVDNAIKYTPAGGTVTLAATRSALTNGSPPQVEIAVSDTGPGIPEKDLPRLTERFYRVDKARSRDLGGTGLGLAIVKHIVQAHQGELKIESEINRGTTVRVRLLLASPNRKPPVVLFLCAGNSCRSQMAEGFARQLVPGTPIYSAGTAPKGIHPMAARVMKEAGIDITRQQSKGLEAIPVDRVDLLITLCGEAAENCASIPASIKRLHWTLPDPVLAQGDEAQVLPIFRRVRDDIRARVQELFARAPAE